MAKPTIQDYEAAIRKELPNTKSISLIGGLNRRNSFTFKVADTSDVISVVKILKKSSGADANINNEKKSLEAIDGMDDLRVSKLIGSGDLKVKTASMPYLVFPYYEGDVLSQLASGGRTCSEQEVSLFIKSVSETVIRLGDVGLIHQDIKPDNIIRLRTGEYIVLDLGISRFSKLEASFVKQQGPAAYLSMEQVELGTARNIVNQRRMSFLSDLNSVGIVALNLLLGDDFNRKWEVDRRKEAAERIRAGEIVEIHDPQLRELIASLLEASPSTRFLKLNNLLDFKPFIPTRPMNKRYWSLHKATGLTFIDKYSNENPDKPLGLVLSADAINSVANTTRTVSQLVDKGWKVAIDPSTHKLLYNLDHHAFLKDRQYYYDDLYEERFFDSSFTNTFVSQVVEFERSIDPTLYISPYFYIKSANSSLISVGINLYEETRKQLNTLSDSRPLALGLSVAKSLVMDAPSVDLLADQIVLLRSVDIVYLNVELTKSDNTPTKDEEYLRGIKRLVDRIATTKYVIVAQIDQASLGLLCTQNVAIAVNPHVGYRKNDIDEKLKEEKDENRFGPKSKDRRHRVYIPKLLTDLDVSRDLNNPGFKALDSSVNITGSKTSKYYALTLNTSDNEARNKQFTKEFSEQAAQLTQPTATLSKAEFKRIIDDSKIAYKAINDAGIKLDGNQSSDFLGIWEKVFL